MDGIAGSPSPASSDAYRRRRDSYSAAMIDEASIFDESRNAEPQPIPQNRTKMPDGLSSESESWSTESSLMKRDLTRTPSTDTSRSWNGSIEIPETFAGHAEMWNRLARCRCLVAKLSISSECQCLCRCQCRCSQCQYYRRKISSCSSNRDQPFLAGFRRKDSGYSVSTCQSVLPPSSGRNSAASLFHEIRGDGRESGIVQDEVIQRRHSDQTQSPRGCKIGRVDNRRFSEQTIARRSSGCILEETGATQPIIARTCPRSFPEKIATGEPWTRLHNENHRGDRTSREATADKRSARKKKREEDVGAGERRRSSTVSVTPKMMRRRFSEQLILEAGLGSVHDYEDLLREPEDAAEEESLTVANARKRITLKRHYYPEGGWGHVIALVAILVQVICHGLQLGSGILISSSVVQFQCDLAEAGTNSKLT
ncbi:uncharacterized protein LOC113464882 [Ceratina calcarata]|uniref:Uncharacterized protein LOC113464882 n=1 Tax=Ceratina calcarata TaxID=156304 RepID=A0AAJ7S9K5_9HYME|nr:uncharacterized protein LOC113464882 [Ceratina calcarata]